jgi:hypothetical protein
MIPQAEKKSAKFLKKIIELLAKLKISLHLCGS